MIVLVLWRNLDFLLKMHFYFWPQELTNDVKEPIGVVYFDNSNNTIQASATPEDGLKASTAQGRFHFLGRLLKVLLLSI